MGVRRVGLVEMEAAVGSDALHDRISATHIEGCDHWGRLGLFHGRYAQRLRGLLGRPGLFTVQEPERERSNQAHANRTSHASTFGRLAATRPEILCQRSEPAP